MIYEYTVKDNRIAQDCIYMLHGLDLCYYHVHQTYHNVIMTLWRCRYNPKAFKIIRQAFDIDIDWC